MPATLDVEFVGYGAPSFGSDGMRRSIQAAFNAWTSRFDYTVGTYTLNVDLFRSMGGYIYQPSISGDTYVQVGSSGGTAVVATLFGLNVSGRNGTAPTTPTLQLEYNIVGGETPGDLEAAFEHALGVRSSRGTAPASSPPAGTQTVWDYGVQGSERPTFGNRFDLLFSYAGPDAQAAYKPFGSTGIFPVLSLGDGSVFANTNGQSVNSPYKVGDLTLQPLDVAFLRDAGLPALTDQELVEHQIARLYFATYGRVATGTELTGSTRYYNAALAAGQAPATILSTIGTALVSDPALASNLASLPPADFVQVVYQNTFGRSPDAQTASAIAQYVASTGASGRGAVLLALTDTDEARGRLSANANVTYAGTVEAQVARLYDTAFGRAADPGGFAQYTRALISGFTLKQAALSFLQSGEFASRYGAAPSDQALVDGLYQNTLGRAPDAAGEAQYLRALASGTFSRTDLAVAFSESGEHIGLMAQRASARDASGLFANTQPQLGIIPMLSGTAPYPGPASSGSGNQIVLVTNR